MQMRGGRAGAHLDFRRILGLRIWNWTSSTVRKDNAKVGYLKFGHYSSRFLSSFQVFSCVLRVLQRKIFAYLDFSCIIEAHTWTCTSSIVPLSKEEYADKKKQSRAKMCHFRKLF